MKAIEVDAAARSAQAQGGALWGQLDRATQAFGLAVPGGTDSEVGIAGLTLGGGNGWLMGVHGATCDNLLSADVVMADGRTVTANCNENTDLFLGLRAAGGNSGLWRRSAIGCTPLARRSLAVRSCTRMRTPSRSCAISAILPTPLPIR